MSTEKDLFTRSDAVQEVIGRPPRWLVQWGTLLVFAIVTLLGWIGFFLEYPEFIEGEILVQSTNPALSVVAVIVPRSLMMVVFTVTLSAMV